MDTIVCSPDEGEVPAPPKPLSQIVQPASYYLSCCQREVTVDRGGCFKCLDPAMGGCWNRGFALFHDEDHEDSRHWRAATKAVNHTKPEGLHGRYRPRESVPRARRGGPR